MDIPGDCITNDKELKYLAILVGPLKNLCCVHNTLQEHFYILHTGQGWLCCRTSGALLFANSTFCKFMKINLLLLDVSASHQMPQSGALTAAMSSVFVA